MSKPTEQVLREIFAERAGPIEPATDFYAGTAPHNRRRRRTQVIAAAVAAAVVATGVPLALSQARGGSAAPTATAPATHPTRGSLAGDKALLAEAVRLLVAEPAPPEAAGAVVPSTVQVSYAEQTAGYRVVLLYGTTRDGTVVSLIAGGAAGAALTGVGGGSGRPENIDARLGQQHYYPQHLLTRFTIGNRSFGVALFPDGYRATIKHGGSIAADCTLATGRASTLPVPSFFAIDGSDAPYVAVSTPQGAKATALALEPAGNASALQTPQTESEIAAQVRSSIRGKKSVATELAGYADTFIHGVGTAELPDHFIGVWAGDLPTGRGYAALSGGVYPSGAVVLQGVASDQSGNGFSGWLTGCFPKGGLDHRVVAARLRTAQTDIPDSPIVIIAPAGAVTAEVSFGSGAPVPVPLIGGGGFLRHGGTAGQVRALDAAGHVVGTGRVDQGPIGVPLQPR